MHHHEHGCGPEGRFLHFGGRRGGRGFGGPGGGPGWGGGMGDGFRVGRMVAGGDLRLIVLFLLEESPRHGYDLIKAIEERSSGFYSPSPGVIYPALTYLEEAGYATASTEGNKKTYAITDTGKAHLAENRVGIEAVLTQLGKVGSKMSRMKEWFGREGEPSRPDRDIPDVLPEVNDARRALKSAIASKIGADSVEQSRVAEILRRAAVEIEGGRNDGPIDL
jgi:DNA-binding PadR family transcriptional regulator